MGEGLTATVEAIGTTDVIEPARADEIKPETRLEKTMRYCLNGSAKSLLRWARRQEGYAISGQYPCRTDLLGIVKPTNLPYIERVKSEN